LKVFSFTLLAKQQNLNYPGILLKFWFVFSLTSYRGLISNNHWRHVVYTMIDRQNLITKSTRTKNKIWQWWMCLEIILHVYIACRHKCMQILSTQRKIPDGPLTERAVLLQTAQKIKVYTRKKHVMRDQVVWVWKPGYPEAEWQREVPDIRQPVYPAQSGFQFFLSL